MRRKGYSSSWLYLLGEQGNDTGFVNVDSCACVGGDGILKCCFLSFFSRDTRPKVMDPYSTIKLLSLCPLELI